MVLIVFIASKIPALHYPFFWDESWSYEPGLRLMHDHGPSLMPNAIDTFFSRGHPLLFYASAATWMKIFGVGHVAQHSFSLFISCLTLVAVYEVCLSLFSQRNAILALLLVATQVIFFVQSTLMLPEMMVALLMLLSIYYYSTQKYLPAFLSISALMLTKESGMAMGLVLGLHATMFLFNKAIPYDKRIKNFASVAGAGVVIISFFLLQWKLNGWLLYPEHISYIDTSWELFKGKLRFCTEIIYSHQYRTYFFAFLALCSLATAIVKKNIKLASLFVLTILLIILSDELMGYISRRIFIPLVCGVLIYTFHTLAKFRNDDDKQTRFVQLSVFCFIAYVSFCCINFFTDRYLLASLVIMLILSAYALDTYLALFKPPLFYISLLGICIFSFLGFTNNYGLGDVDLQIYDAMDVQQGVVNYMETNNLYDHAVWCPSALNRAHLTQPYTGFLHSQKAFKTVTYDLQPSTEFLIIDNIEEDKSIDTNKIKEQFILVHRVSKGISRAEIYKRR